MIATTSTAIADDAASNGTSQPYGNTAAANTTTTVKELSELLFSNRTTHQSSMKKSRVNFQASLVDKSKKEKQAERTTFRRIKEEKQQLFKNSQTVHRKLFFSKIESKEEKKAAHAALKSLMMEKKKKNGNGTNAAKGNHSNTIVDPNLAGKVKELSEILLSNRKTHQASMHDSRLNCQASLAGKTPEEKKKERTIFRVIQQEKRQSFQNAQKKHRKLFFSNLESQDEKKAACCFEIFDDESEQEQKQQQRRRTRFFGWTGFDDERSSDESGTESIPCLFGRTVTDRKATDAEGVSYRNEKGSTRKFP